MTCFKSGPNVNVITVTVEDTLGGLTSLIVEGTVTYEDCDRLPVRKISGLSSITFFESTFATPTPHLVPISDARLTARIPTSSFGSGNNDFEGVPNAEFYDVFFSGWDGTVDLNGEFVTIEAVWNVGAPSGGGLNIAAVQLNFNNGNTSLADFVSSFVALGNNAIPLDVGKAVDTDTVTDTTMGNTIGQTKQRLRVTVGFSCPCAPPPSGMVAWWPLDGLNSNGEYTDLAGGDNNGTPIGPPSPILGQHVGNSIQASTGYVEVSDAPNLNFGPGSFTIDGWVKFTPGTQTEPIVYKLSSPSGSGGGYFLSIDNPNLLPTQRRLQLQVATNLYSGPIITATQGTWIFVAVTVDKVAHFVNFYVGVPGGPLAPFPPLPAGAFSASSPGTPLWIGEWPGDPHAFLGIDEVEIFNRALSQTEIQSIFTAQSAGKCKVRRATR